MAGGVTAYLPMMYFLKSLKIRIMEPFETKEYRGYEICIGCDELVESPREWSCDTTIYSNHRDYNPDDHTIEEILSVDGNGLDENFIKNNIYLKVYGYSHGGMTVSVTPFNDPWDSGMFGIIAIKKETAIKLFGKKICTKKVKQDALKRLERDVEVYDKYLTDDIYCYCVKDEYGDVIYSCGGFYGREGIEEAIVEAEGHIDTYIKEKEDKYNKNIEKIKAHVTEIMGSTFIQDDMAYRVSKTPLFSEIPVIEMAKIRRGKFNNASFNSINIADIGYEVAETMASAINC